MRVGAYVRSSKDLGGERWGVETQRTVIAQHADRLGWTVTAWYEDNDVSATKRRGAKTQWAAMLAAAKADEFDVIVAVDIDRLVRSLSDLLTLTELKVKIATVDGEIDLTSADGEFRGTMLAAMARFEVRRKSERQTRSNARRRNEGQPVLSGKTPFGYTKAGEVVPEQAEAVRQAFRDFLGEPARPISRIADDLNAAGHRTTRGQLWSPYAVRYLLQNALYAGQIRHHATGELFPVQGPGFPPLVAADAWRAAVAKIESNAAKANRRGNTAKYLLSGIARCGRCGGVMTAAVASSGLPTYRCHEYKHLSRQRELVDLQVEAAVVQRLADPALADLITSAEGMAGEDARNLRQIREDERRALRTRLDVELRSMLTDPVVDIAVVRQAMVDVQQRITELDELLRPAATHPAAGVLEVVADSPGRERVDVAFEWWESLDLYRRRAIVASLVQVTIDPIRPGHVRFDPSLVRISPLSGL